MSTYTQNYSDARLKEIIGLVEDPLNKIKQLSGVYYHENDLARKYGYNSTERKIGLIAQDLEKVLPEAIHIAPFDADENDNSVSGERYLTVKYERVIPLLIESLKKQKEQINYLRSLLMKQAVVTNK
jgi:hypothetical protein